MSIQDIGLIHDGLDNELEADLMDWKKVLSIVGGGV